MAMGRREVPMSNGDEYEALTRWRKYVHWSRGELAQIKKRFRRRERRYSRVIEHIEMHEIMPTPVMPAGGSHAPQAAATEEP